jgi:hypothetical protein
MAHSLIKATLAIEMIEILQAERNMKPEQAFEYYYNSRIPELLFYDELGLWGQSAQFLLALNKD